MDRALVATGADLTNGFLGADAASNVRFQISNVQIKNLLSGAARSRNDTKKCLSISCSQSRGRRCVNPAAVATDRESRVEQLEKAVENGAGNGAVYKRVAKLEEGLRNGSYINDEGRRTISVHDYMEQVPFFLTDDGGPPRWFSPLIPEPPADAPALFFVPGLDGTGLGLILHHETLGRIFNVQCLNIPVHDRTPFTGLIKIVEDTMLVEHERRPTSPIYLVGDSFGGALILAVAARNPTLDLVLILVNPATSFDRSQLQPLFPLLQAAPSELFVAVPYLLSFIMGDPVRMAEGRVKESASADERSQQLRDSLVSLLPTLPTLADVVPKDALLWKLKLLHSAALYTNSRLHAVRGEVLVLASGKDLMLPSVEEARRLKKALQNCRTRYYKDSGHTLLLEGGFNLASVIKGAGCYRHGKKWDPVQDFVVPTNQEFNTAYEKNAKLIRQLLSPVFFSTSDDGKVDQGLLNIPNDRPLLFVGNHIYMGLDLSLVIGEVFKQRNVLIRGLAHPVIFSNEMEADLQEPTIADLFRTFGAVPVSGKVTFKLLKSGYTTLLYPGGAREALHRKGEAHKLFWPHRSEFVRMAARFGYTIIPMATVGEDDVLNILLDLNDLRKIPTLEERFTFPISNIRQDLEGEIADQPLHFPFAAPKLNPGRLYIKFGKPIYTAGRETELQNKKEADVLYKHVQGEVDRGLEYLQWKRQEDPYREFLPRILYEQTGGGNRQAPTFKP